ncbi:outer membrane protein assembly factor BamA [Neorhizobium galegae]|uniref:outer membrane protein assembly factor BamA n=1 Tax=Neorhizobium galegae TaxID=399 RepID=UPI000621E222|nr:outer membrane protein assembly factor BamA [Neorhizobium galegae]CDZ55437.1 Outer membrane protein assembly factor BamA [Neorhizobium galegae bv. orientalis]KAB1125863.1 outer membrane protein assembly factor BamA [Neorhizobium galegae]MCQ1806138.1 outer membrane protein assembly factor BamA [Neorhizobium galegae]MCQ1836998.1 outer membrane protein assembly factor BamA [Neorhizobium galegae]UIY30830.1 outer membrane protein assembly factor BamA [Neorhizobium galegae]
MKAGSKFLNAVSAFALSASVVASGAGVLVLASALSAEAAVIRSVQVRGAQRAGEEAVRSNLTIRPGVNFSNNDIDESVRKLYSTGYFSDVKISVSGSTLVVSVSENQLINQVVFNGNRKITDDKLQAVVQTQPLGPYNQALVDADIQRLREAYRAIGRSDVQITTQTADVGQGRVNLAFVINEGDRTKIADISFVGNQAYGDGRLKSVLITKESGPLSFLTRKDVYSEDKLRADEEALRQFYYNHGYPDFRVISSEAVLDESGNKYNISFTVEEGQRYEYGNVSVESTVQGISGQDLEGLVETRAGNVYNAREIQKSMEAISKRVAAAGYPFARVTPRGDRNMENHTVGVSYLVDQGERAYVERIEIRGNTRTRDYVIRREFDFSEGDAFNQEMISRAKRRLEALGYFTTVNISTSQGTSPDRVVIVVDVEDQPTGSFGIGAGYSAGGDGFLLEASIEEKNFLGRGQFIRVAVGGGLDEARSYNLSFTEPYFLGYRLAAGFDLFKSKTSSNEYYDYDEQGVTLRVTAPITEDLATTFRYTYKEIQYDNDGAFGTDGVPGTVDDNLSSPYISMIDQGKFVQSSISQTLTYNTLDSQTLPREGIYATITHEYAGLGGDSDFYKISGRARYFQLLSTEADLIGSIAVGAGHVVSTGDNLHVFDQFTIGGRQIRGFENDGIGPRTTDHGDALGGTTYFTASAEMTMPMPAVPEDFGLRAAIFADAGTLYGNDVPLGTSAAQGTSMNWRASVGAGVMWASPFGNIRFDYAHPVMKEDFDETQEFRFSMANQF